MYDVARTAHFERALRSGVRTTILFEVRRYDFDEQLAASVGARRAGLWGAFWYALRHDIDVLEIAEPLVARAAPRTLAAVFGTRVRAIRSGRRARVVSYAIENKNPWDGHKTLPLHAQVKLRAQLALVAAVWKRLDRIAFGTSQSAELYARRFARTRGHRPVQAVVPALPVAESVATAAREPVVTFLGEFSVRKGFDLVCAAWPPVADTHPDATLVLMGKGAGVPDAEALAAGTPSVRAIIDPPRDELFAQLEATKVLVLPSQPRPRWREQVGLPIVEGLGRGCIIVTTTETGLAEWLGDHGHHVVAPNDAVALGEAISRALDERRSPAEVLADLPEVDGRAAAERWLLSESVPARD